MQLTKQVHELSGGSDPKQAIDVVTRVIKYAMRYSSWQMYQITFVGVKLLPINC